MKINSTKRSVLKNVANAKQSSVSGVSKVQDATIDERIKSAYIKLYNDIFQPRTIKKIK
jgi:hypothetical protein